jgi:ADP-ribosylation factor-binding protein GGA
MAAHSDSGQTLESLLFKATNPSNKLEDVNTIKQFCDAVNSNMGGDAAAMACKLLAHKIQSPQEREALQALAVLEACVKSCGPVFQAEVGKFKFLNEMIKLVSPKYLVSPVL